MGASCSSCAGEERGWKAGSVSSVRQSVADKQRGETQRGWGETRAPVRRGEIDEEWVRGGRHVGGVVSSGQGSGGIGN